MAMTREQEKAMFASMGKGKVHKIRKAKLSYSPPSGWKVNVNRPEKVSWESMTEEKEIFITPSFFNDMHGSWEAFFIKQSEDPYKLDKLVSKEFKNKDDAIKFAMKYMREN